MASSASAAIRLTSATAAAPPRREGQDHWLASPLREEVFGPLGVPNIRTFVDPQNPTQVGGAHGRRRHGCGHGRDGKRRDGPGDGTGRRAARPSGLDREQLLARSAGTAGAPSLPRGGDPGPAIENRESWVWSDLGFSVRCHPGQNPCYDVPPRAETIVLQILYAESAHIPARDLNSRARIVRLVS